MTRGYAPELSIQAYAAVDVLITVRHHSADTVVGLRAMNEVNGKCRFSGSGIKDVGFDGFSRNFAQLIMSATPPHTQM